MDILPWDRLALVLFYPLFGAAVGECTRLWWISLSASHGSKSPHLRWLWLFLYLTATAKLTLWVAIAWLTGMPWLIPVALAGAWWGMRVHLFDRLSDAMRRPAPKKGLN